MDSFDFTAIPTLNKQLVLELARCEYVQHRENDITIGNRGTSKTHVALGLGLVACRQGTSVGFTAAGLAHELMEARDERRLLNLARMEPSKGSLRGKLKQVGWDNSYLATLLSRFTNIQMR